MNGAQLRAAMHSGTPVWGTMMVYGRDPQVASVYAQLGLDYVIVDTEHTPLGRSEAADVGAALLAAGVCPVIRVPHTEPHEVIMALDAGFHGVVVPYCETVDQVRAVVNAGRLRPLKGALLERAVTTGEFPSEETKQYIEKRNANVVTIIGIESVPAVENLESILDVPGVDALFIGPGDLCVSLGIPEQFEHPRYVEAVEHIIATAQARGIPAGPHCFNERALLRWHKSGMRFILFSADIRALGDGFRDSLATARAGVAAGSGAH